MRWKLDWHDCLIFAAYSGAIAYCTVLWSWQGFLYASACCVIGATGGYFVEPLLPRNVVQTVKSTWRHVVSNRQLAVLTLALALSLVVLSTAFVAGYKTEIRSPSLAASPW